MKTKLAAVGFAAAISLATISGAMAAKPPDSPGKGPADKELVCHATASDTNPYVMIEVSAKAVERAHNNTHHNPPNLPERPDLDGDFREGGCPQPPPEEE